MTRESQSLCGRSYDSYDPWDVALETIDPEEIAPEFSKIAAFISDSSDAFIADRTELLQDELRDLGSETDFSGKKMELGSMYETPTRPKRYAIEKLWMRVENHHKKQPDLHQ